MPEKCKPSEIYRRMCKAKFVLIKKKKKKRLYKWAKYGLATMRPSKKYSPLNGNTLTHVK